MYINNLIFADFWILDFLFQDQSNCQLMLRSLLCQLHSYLLLILPEIIFVGSKLNQRGVQGVPLSAMSSSVWWIRTRTRRIPKRRTQVSAKLRVRSQSFCWRYDVVDRVWWQILVLQASLCNCNNLASIAMKIYALNGSISQIIFHFLPKNLPFSVITSFSQNLFDLVFHR